MEKLSAAQVIALLQLQPHPEGGYFQETWHQDENEAPIQATEDFRPVGTCIYFLLEKGQVSRFHRLDADEVWHFYCGDPLELTLLGKNLTVIDNKQGEQNDAEKEKSSDNSEKKEEKNIALRSSLQKRRILGPHLQLGQRPQQIIPANVWQTAKCYEESQKEFSPAVGWSLVGCTVSPGFHVSGFQLAPSGRHKRNLMSKLLIEVRKLAQKDDNEKKKKRPSEKSFIAHREIKELRDAFEACLGPATFSHPDSTSSPKKSEDNDDGVFSPQSPGSIQRDTLHWTSEMKEIDTLLTQLETKVVSSSQISGEDAIFDDDDDDEAKRGKKPHHVHSVWAPLHVPTQRRLQTLAVTHNHFFIGLPFWIVINVLLLLYAPIFIRALHFLYIGYIFFVPKKVPFSRKSWYTNSQYWKYYRDYFPVRLTVPKPVQEAITPDKNYMFIAHPHGVHAFGCGVNFLADANDLGEILPGITIHMQTLRQNFWVPFWRELFVWGGAGDASKSTIVKTLNSGPGESVALVVGGAEESLYFRPHTNDLALKKRKGFVKIALQTGASLVPVFNFGENNVYGNYAEGHPVIQKALKFLQKKLGFAVLLISGRGWFNYNFGLLPHRRPIHTVMGMPIHIPKVEAPSQEEIDHYHALYMRALSSLYEENKEIYDLHCRTAMKLVS